MDWNDISYLHSFIYIVDPSHELELGTRLGSATDQ